MRPNRVRRTIRIAAWALAAASSVATGLELGSAAGGYYLVAAGNVSAEEIEKNPRLAGIVDIRKRTIFPLEGYPSNGRPGAHVALSGGPGECPVGLLLRDGTGADVYRWRPDQSRFLKGGRIEEVSMRAGGMTVSGCRILIYEEATKSSPKEKSEGFRWMLFSPDGSRRLWIAETYDVNSIVYSSLPLERPGGRVLHGNYLLDLATGRIEHLVKKDPPGSSSLSVWAWKDGRRMALSGVQGGRLLESVDGIAWKPAAIPPALAARLAGDSSSPTLLLDPAGADHAELWMVPHVALPPGVTGQGPFFVLRTRDAGRHWDSFLVEREEYLEPPVPGPNGTRIQFSPRQASDGSIPLRIWTPGKPFEEIQLRSAYSN